jgi:hypothetical protein
MGARTDCLVICVIIVCIASNMITARFSILGDVNKQKSLEEHVYFDYVFCVAFNVI